MDMSTGEGPTVLPGRLGKFNYLTLSHLWTPVIVLWRPPQCPRILVTRYWNQSMVAGPAHGGGGGGGG